MQQAQHPDSAGLGAVLVAAHKWGSGSAELKLAERDLVGSLVVEPRMVEPSVHVGY